MKNLYNELRAIEMQFHELVMLEEHSITIRATTLDPYGVDEVMRIKEIADRFHMHTNWDGQNIEIVRYATDPSQTL